MNSLIDIENKHKIKVYSDFVTDSVDKQSNNFQPSNKIRKQKTKEITPLNNLKLANNMKSCINFKYKVDLNNEKEIEKKIIKKIKKNIQVLHKGNSEKLNLGSLFELFQSPYFDINLLIFYLDRKEEIGIIDCLANLLASKYINESFFYIPQLCTMITFKNYFESIENYLLDRCVDQLKFSLKIHWLISSYSENAFPKISKKYDKLVQRIEMTLVNGRRATLSSFKLYNTLHIKSEEEVYKHSLDKEYRLNYFDRVVKFYHDLRVMCEKLKDVLKDNLKNPKLNRNNVMRNRLKDFNLNIEKLRNTKILKDDTNSVTSLFYKGYILPFDDTISTMDDYNTLIVRFIPEHSFCFSTKARVPVKITAETVRVLECQYWDELIIDNNENNEEDKESSNNAPNSIRSNSTNHVINPFSNSNSINDNYSINNTIDNKEFNVKPMMIEYTSIDDFFSKIESNDKISNSSKTNANTNNHNSNQSELVEDSIEQKAKEAQKIVDRIIKENGKFKLINYIFIFLKKRKE